MFLPSTRPSCRESQDVVFAKCPNVDRACTNGIVHNFFEENPRRVYPADLRRVNTDHVRVTEYSPAERAFASTFAKTLIERRRRMGLTQEQVALAADINRNHYQLMEHARADRRTNSPANPRMSTLIKLAKVFDCSVPDLLEAALADYQAVEDRS